MEEKEELKNGDLYDNGIDEEKIPYNLSGSKVKPFRNWTYGFYIALLAIAYVLGASMFSGASSTLEIDNIMLYALISIFGSFIVIIIVYELGKIIFGKLAGYRLIKVSILGFSYSKYQDKGSFGFTGIENLGGSTFMVPTKERANPFLYLLGGFFLYLLTGGVLLALSMSSIIPNEIRYLFVIYGGIGFLYSIYNLTPFKLDSINDGFIFRNIAANPQNKIAYHQNLFQELALRSNNGKLDYYQYDTDEAFFQAKALVYNYYYCLEKGDYDKAEKICNRIIKRSGYLVEDDIGEAYIGKVFFMLIRGEIDEVSSYYWTLPKSMRRHLTYKKNLCSLKVALLIASSLDINYEECRQINKAFKEISSKVIYPTLLKVETELYQQSLAKVKQEHPDWNLDNNA